jgi:hypothetical protein
MSVARRRKMVSVEVVVAAAGAEMLKLGFYICYKL